jgi:hypothetical protein
VILHADWACGFRMTELQGNMGKKSGRCSMANCMASSVARSNSGRCFLAGGTSSTIKDLVARLKVDV